MTTQPITAVLQSDKRKNTEALYFRFMTDEEILALSYGDHPHVKLNNGRVGRVKINGAIKRWARDPGRIEVPVKYGMYECARLSFDEARARFMVLL